jgi:quercetin dioxygenase-like cupin family protein
MIAPKTTKLAEGVVIIDDAAGQPGVDTLEGIVGPLLQGVDNQVHFLDLPPGMYTYEHAHPTESLIYTVRGQWVLCSDGNRHHMKPGSVFWFGPGIPTGYEVPFNEPALILAFKSRSPGTIEDFVDYVQNKMNPKLVEEHENGTPFFLKELSEDHPARVFGRTVNPESEW